MRGGKGGRKKFEEIIKKLSLLGNATWEFERGVEEETGKCGRGLNAKRANWGLKRTSEPRKAGDISLRNAPRKWDEGIMTRI